MITNEVNVFKKFENAKRALGDHEESAHHGVSVMVWLSAIQHSRSAERNSKSAKQHSKSAKWHSSVAKWHVAPRSYILAIPCSFMFSCNFFKAVLIFKKIFF